MCECLMGMMRQIIHLSDQYIAKRLKEENVPILSAHIPLFYLLPQDGEGMLFNELCSKWNKSKSSLSDMITKYVDEGLLKRCACTEDKRNIYIAMTPQALKIKAVLDQIEEEVYAKLFEGDSPEVRKQFAGIIRQMLLKGKEIL